MTLRIEQFGPQRAIGVAYRGKNENKEIPELWDKSLLPRAGEIQQTTPPVGLGICRCIAGASDGSFEYIAAFAASAHAPLPEGMVELELPAADYAVFEVASLADLPAAWQRVQAGMGEQKQWLPRCGPHGCECATHPSFELYPETFAKDGKLLLIPVKHA